MKPEHARRGVDRRGRRWIPDAVIAISEHHGPTARHARAA
jgi:hypothetical protein